MTINDCFTFVVGGNVITVVVVVGVVVAVVVVVVVVVGVVVVIGICTSTSQTPVYQPKTNFVSFFVRDVTTGKTKQKSFFCYRSRLIDCAPLHILCSINRRSRSIKKKEKHTLENSRCFYPQTIPLDKPYTSCFIRDCQQENRIDDIECLTCRSIICTRAGGIRNYIYDYVFFLESIIFGILEHQPLNKNERLPRQSV